MAISKGNEDVIAKLVPGGDLGLAHLSDDELLANTRRLVGKTNQLLAALLAHLAEVDARGVHRTRRCASLYTYCIYELRFSEDAAARRSAAARLVRQFPVLFAAITNGELHLTGLLMIGPHLTPENHLEVLGRAKFRTKKELGKLLRDLNPLPQVPDRIEPLGPPQLRALRNPTWEEYVTSLAPRVRELPPEERPSEWGNELALAAKLGRPRNRANEATLAAEFDGTDDAGDPAVRAEPVDRADETGGSTVAEPPVVTRSSAIAGAPATTQEERLPVGPVPQNLPPVTGPQHYQVQFCTVEEHAQLVERAKALLARSRPGMTLGELHLEAMKLLVASLEKRKFAVNDRPQSCAQTKREATARSRRDEQVSAPAHQRAEDETHAHETGPTPRQRGASECGASEIETGPIPRQRGASEIETAVPTRQRGASGTETAVPTRQRGASETVAGPTPRQRGASETRAFETGPTPRQRGGGGGEGGEGGEGGGRDGGLAATRQHERPAISPSEPSRYIPACERREVYQRDVGRCTYVDARGERCCETRYLELHHLKAFAKQGASVAANLTLRCAAHNALAAEEDFGASFMSERRNATKHEVFAVQHFVAPDTAS